MLSSFSCKRLFLVLIIGLSRLHFSGSFSFESPTTTTIRRRPRLSSTKSSYQHQRTLTSVCALHSENNSQDSESSHSSLSRRRWLASSTSAALLFTASNVLINSPAYAASSSSSEAEITDKVYITVKGLPSQDGTPSTPQRIVIGLFGKDAPNSVQQFKKLVTKDGLPAECRPKAIKQLQKEQLEANKVYNSCIEGKDINVNLQYSTIWRIVPNERIDLGAVTGRFVAREYPTWQEEESTTTTTTSLKHDQPGVVSVRKGNDSGFGFTIYPGDGRNGNSALDQEHIIIGRVIEGLDIVQQLNSVPVINTSKGVNYMALTGGPKTNNAPDRSCRYGGPMYCNENKPLVKLMITETGIL